MIHHFILLIFCFISITTGIKRTLFWNWQWSAPINHLLSGLQCLKLWLYMKAKKPSRIFLKRSLPRSLLLEYRMVNIYIVCFAMFPYLLFLLLLLFHWFVSLDPPIDEKHVLVLKNYGPGNWRPGSLILCDHIYMYCFMFSIIITTLFMFSFHPSSNSLLALAYPKWVLKNQ